MISSQKLRPLDHEAGRVLNVNLSKIGMGGGHCSILTLLSTINRTDNLVDILPSARMYLQRLPETFTFQVPLTAIWWRGGGGIVTDACTEIWNRDFSIFFNNGRSLFFSLSDEPLQHGGP